MLKKNKAVWISLVIVFTSIFSYKAFAYTIDDVYNAIMSQGKLISEQVEKVKKDILAYFAASKSKEVAANAEDKYKKAPGAEVVATTSVANAGSKIKEINTAITDAAIIPKKEVNDINFNLYGENFPGESVAFIGDGSTNIADEHFRNYCSEALANKGSGGMGGLIGGNKLCQAKNPNTMYLDVSIASSLLDKKVLTEADKNFAALAIRNLISPAPSLKLKTALETDKNLQKTENRRAVALLLAEIAATDPAYYSLNHAYKMRVATMVNKEGSSGEKEPKSMMEIIDLEATRRFQNPEWYQKIDAATDTSLLREIAHINAFNTWLQYQKYLQDERIEALLIGLQQVLITNGRSADKLIEEQGGAPKP